MIDTIKDIIALVLLFFAGVFGVLLAVALPAIPIILTLVAVKYLFFM